MSQPPHTAKCLFFGCIDDRLAGPDDAFIATLEGSAFHPNMAGGGAAFLSTDDRTSALKQIVAAYKINHITDVYLQSHTDCGAYRLAGVSFDSPEQEIERLYADLEQAAGHIRTALAEAGAPDNEVQLHLRVVDPTGRLLPNLQPA